MKLVVDGAARNVTVDDAEDLNKLSVELRECSPEQASALLEGLGRLQGKHAWLNIDALQAIAPKPRSCSWDERFRRAMAYAERHGWTDLTGSFVRAHVASSDA
jgi:NADH:ubiquinone oxidoreductase subunit E